MSGYKTFAGFYDTLMNRVDYEKRGDYLLSVFKKYGQDPACLLDLACGSGRLTRFLALQGKEMVGVDASCEMLSVAREETPADTDILWVCQDLRELDLYGTAQGAVSTFDSLNHITGQGELKDFFTRLRYFLEPGNLFVFDVNTPYKHQH
ncbi:MAG: class I SAM-dependent methyltransferase, partial [Clostridia bacterium]|nr:class I SAM-dependent methyltransferase [Clostridia bacterium]